MIINILLYILAFASAIVLRRHELAHALLFALIFTAHLALSKQPRQLFLAAIIVATILTMICMICVAYGLFTFDAKYAAIPIWLPLAWAIVTCFVLDIYNVVNKNL